MKSTICVILALVLCLSMFGCTKAENGGSTEPTTQVGPSNKPIGYGFTYQGVTFGIGMDADTAIAALGAPKSESKTASCAFGGYDYAYIYDNFIISANDENGYKRIYCISLENDMAETQQNIYRGCMPEDVLEKYGDPTSSNAAGMYYAKDGMELQFMLKDNVVDRIQYIDSSVG